MTIHRIYSVTLAWSTSAVALKKKLDDLGGVPSCHYVIDQIALGTTGDHGTVLRGKDLLVVDVPYV